MIDPETLIPLSIVGSIGGIVALGIYTSGADERRYEAVKDQGIEFCWSEKQWI